MTPTPDAVCDFCVDLHENLVLDPVMNRHNPTSSRAKVLQFLHFFKLYFVNSKDMNKENDMKCRKKQKV